MDAGMTRRSLFLVALPISVISLMLVPYSSPAQDGRSTSFRAIDSRAVVRTVMAPSHGAHRDQVLPLHAVQEHIRRVLFTELAGKVVELEVTLIDPQEPVVLPTGTVELDVHPRGGEGNLGRRSFAVDVLVHRRLVHTVDVTADVAGSIEVVVPTRLINSDEVIQADDLTLSKVKVYNFQQVYAARFDEVAGKSATRPLQATTPIRLSTLKKPYIIRKGDRITIEAKHGRLAIQTTGVTKTSGHLGDMVTVANVDSGKEILGKIVGPGVIRVDY
jgi:flagella basal body P-ring formation protein FlgA